MSDPKDPCPDCGAPLGVREGCDAAFHELGARAAAERSGDPRAERAVWSDLTIPPDAVKPALPAFRGR